MVQAPAYAPGKPIWVDLGSPDLAGAQRFYGAVFGWDVQTLPAKAGGYALFLKDGRVAAGIGPLQGEGQPSYWATYISTDDADATTAAVTAAGGRVLVPPFDVLDQGRMACYFDPSGAAIAVWQPITMFGAETYNVPGAVCWNELLSRDFEKASAFYQTVFGWATTRGVDGTYTQFELAGRPVAGGMPGDFLPEGVPSNWMVYFQVADLSATMDAIKANGGIVIMGPNASPPGEFAIATDPFGATFAIIQIDPTFVPGAN
jgi:predicted enzyme related to lactoylglutathione lyase